MKKQPYRPNAGPLVGKMVSPRMVTLFDKTLISGLVDGRRWYAEIWCFDSYQVGAKTRTVHTERGRVKLPASEIFALLW